MSHPKKLIEVLLPLKEINAAASREKSLRHGHPSTLHLWWARRPLATARAVIWASIIDDPSSHSELFPTEAEQDSERKRLHHILKAILKWEDAHDSKLLKEAKDEINKATGGKTLALLDPFSGGGTIPLEAARLGLEAHAHDLNPVAVMINKATIEIPPRFAGLRPVHPGDRVSEGDSATGLAEDVRYYGELMKQMAWERIGHLYPTVKIPVNNKEQDATVIAWLWARTVRCPNPACGCETPLAKSFTLSKKLKYHVIPRFDKNGKVTFDVEKGAFKGERDGTVDRKGVVCPRCGEPVRFDHVREEGKAHRLGARLMAIVAEGKKTRVYVSPNAEHERAATVERPLNVPQGDIADYPGCLNCRVYGFDTFESLFTNRQLVALTTFSDLVSEMQQQAYDDALAAGMEDDGLGLSEKGRGAKAYGEAIGIYLAFVVNKLADRGSTFCSWDVSRDGIRNTFGRQAISMSWDYAEGNPFSNSSGCFDNMIDWVAECLEMLPTSYQGEVRQFDAQSDCGLRGILVCTDPPYYDNIGYSDISDYFYVWMRRSLKDTYPKIFSTRLTPKSDELVAVPHHFGGDADKARKFFEDGMFRTCQRIYDYARDDYPVSIYYAYKQKETEDSGNEEKTASTGWETMLSAIINAGFCITGTWPMNTELSNRAHGIGRNTLATSIVIVCRKRPGDAKRATIRDFMNALKRELYPALEKMQDKETNIAPVDMAQCAIGPGMAVYSRYKQVLDADGTPLSIRAALQIINQELDLYFNAQDSTLDAGSRFCVDLYTQDGFTRMTGDPDTLARAKNTSPDALRAAGVLFHERGVTRLLGRDEIDDDLGDGKLTWKLTQQFTRAMDKGGIDGCAAELQKLKRKNGAAAEIAAEDARQLAYRLYQIADKKGDNAEAFVYNSLVTAWRDIVDAESHTEYESKDLIPKFGKKKDNGPAGQSELF